MSLIPFSSARAWVRLISLGGAMAAVAAPAAAQYIGAAPPPPPPLMAGQVESPSAALARNLRLIALNPRDFAALVAAGRAALDLGDLQAAAGFFGRAEELRPSDPAPKIGMGAATAEMGDPRSALILFAQAQQLGASAVLLGADRGLAQDLIGNQAAAQVDYRAGLSGPDRDEARRRLALSLAISRNTTEAIATLQPLLNRRDPAAQRARAFILALGGDRPGARRAIDLAMPGSSARIDPFFMVLPSLSPAQKAAAVHLGVFPTASEMQLGSATPPARQPAPSTAIVATVVAPPPAIATPSLTRTAPQQVASAPIVAAPSTGTAGVSLSAPAPGVASTSSFTLPSTAVVTPVATTAIPIATPSASSSTTVAANTIEPVTTAEDRLSGIDKLLAQSNELSPPPAPRPKVELADTALDRAAEAALADARRAGEAKAKKAAEAKKLAAKKAEAKKLADAKAAETKRLAEEKKEREALGVAGTNWVQIAGGSNEDRMPTEYKKLAAKSSALRKRGGYVTQGKDYFRLLTGPFDSKSEAQSFTNALAKDGVDGFSWTRNPATIKIEKIGSK